MTRKKVTTATFAAHFIFSLLAALSAVYLLVQLSKKVHRQSSDDGLSSIDFSQQKKICSVACPGPMNCSEWSDCIFHQPDSCDKLQLLCFYEDSTLFSDVVLTTTYSGFNWYDIWRIATIDLFIFLLVIGLFLTSIWCFQSMWVQFNIMSMLQYHGSYMQKPRNINILQAVPRSRRGVYAAEDKLKK